MILLIIEKKKTIKTIKKQVNKFQQLKLIIIAEEEKKN